MRPRHRILAAAVAAAVALTAAPAAHADDAKAAAEHFARAEQAEKQGDWRTAIAEYEQSYAAKPHPFTLFNIAADWERLGDLERAIANFERYLDEAGDADPADRQRTEARVARLRAELERRRPATPPAPGVLTVSSPVEGAEVRIDGKLVGQTPFAAAVPAGEHQVVISAPGRRSVERSVVVPSGGSEQIRANLEPLGGPGVEEERPSAGAWIYGFTTGWDGALGGLRYVVDFGYRTRSGRIDLTGQAGLVGSGASVGIGANLRIHLGGRQLQPYIDLGAFSAADGDAKASFVELGVGLLVTRPVTSGQMATTPGRRLAIDYFLAADAIVRLDDPGMDQGRIGVPILVGILLHLG